ncbi:pilus assembly protein TadG-related protein [Streptomyces sp. x-80]|uniref:pilus assembly protein TadG-related protein n=1 Tax=Streptomyces sp. x-80 TaxID=2789282 RepID=UPI003981647F
MAATTARTAGGARRRGGRDAGQAFPLYLVAVAGLLFLALAFFAVGQAAASRNGAQTAADAAALAAGQQYRDQLTKGLLDPIRGGAGGGDGGDSRARWAERLRGRGLPSGPACENADWFAAQNDAVVSACRPDSEPATSFAVTVTSRKPVGPSIIPSTGSTYASAAAKAVVVPRCTLAEDGTGGTGGTGDGDKGGTGDKGGAADGAGQPGPPLGIVCDGRTWVLDPGNLRVLPQASDLFAVRLAQ